jgi:hypothetical protein
MKILKSLNLSLTIMSKIMLNSLSLPTNKKETLEKVLSFFVRKSCVKIETIVAIGSITTTYTTNPADIDLVFYVNPKLFKDNKKIRRILQLINKDYRKLEAEIIKEPRFISDEHNERIESMIKVDGLILDLTYIDGNIKIGKTSYTVFKDNFERHIGNLYVYGKVLYEGKHSRYKKLKGKYLPFYSENLRKKRLSLLEEELKKRISKIRKSSEKGDIMKTIHNFDRVLKILLQYIFIKKKKYPLNYEKYIKEQFEHILQDPITYKKIEEILSHTTLSPASLAAAANSLNEIFESFKNVS